MKAEREPLRLAERLTWALVKVTWLTAVCAFWLGWAQAQSAVQF